MKIYGKVFKNQRSIPQQIHFIVWKSAVVIHLFNKTEKYHTDSRDRIFDHHIDNNEYNVKYIQYSFITVFAQ